MIPQLRGEKCAKRKIKLLVSELCLMVTDNSNFCRFRLGSFLLPFPPGEKKNTITATTTTTITSLLFFLNAL